MESKLRLTDTKVLEEARVLLKDHLPLQVDGYSCKTEDILNVLLAATVQNTTVEAACNDLENVCDANTIRQYLKEQIRVDDLQELEKQLNGALVKDLPTTLWHKARQFSVDLHDEPFYGKDPQQQALWCGGEADRGTTRFYRVATAYVMLKGLRVTLALRFVRPEDTTLGVLKDLLRRVKRLKIRLERLFLDKGFCYNPVLEYLFDQGVPSLLACPIRGKQEGRGTRALCKGNKSYRTRHTFRSPQHGDFTADVLVCRLFTTGKRLKRRAQWLVFVQVHLSLTPKQARKLYRRRFGIESSYRCMRQVKAWTTSRNPALRFVLIALGFVLVNLWIRLRWFFTQVPRKGGRWLDTRRFQLQRLARFITRAVQHIYGAVRSIEAVAYPLR